MMKKQIGGITYKNPKGFTLIELLAVIALILTPIVSGIIKTAKKNAFESTGYGILESTKLYYSKKVGELETDLTFTCNNDTCTSDEEKLEFKGNMNGSGTVLLFKDGNIALCLESEDYATIKNINDERLTTTEQGTCEFNDETKEYAVIGTVSARDYEILQNQYNLLNNIYMNGKNTLVNTLNNKGIETNEGSTLEEIASNIDELPVTFGQDAEGNYGYYNTEGELVYFNESGDMTAEIVKPGYALYTAEETGIYIINSVSANSANYIPACGQSTDGIMLMSYTNYASSWNNSNFRWNTLVAKLEKGQYVRADFNTGWNYTYTIKLV